MTIRGQVTTVLDLINSENADLAITWLTVANAVVDQRLAGTGQSETILARIEEHLAAHYIEMGGGEGGGGRIVTSERLPDWAATYASGDNLATLRSTRNGMIAAQLDTSGTLLEASKPKPSFAVL